MARRDLSRTVIEGGRYYHNAFFRRASHGTARARTREWLAAIDVDVDEADASSPAPLRPVRKMFRDKLAPARRWLASRVGQPWSKVFAELAARFDTRTVAGAHVVHDHLLGWVAREPLDGAREFCVDRHGILRRTWRIDYAAIQAWRGGRRAALTFRGWWWGRVVPAEPACTEGWRCNQRPRHRIGADHYHVVLLVAETALTKGDRRRLAQLPDGLYDATVIRDCEVRFGRAPTR